MKTIKTKLGWPGLHGKGFELNISSLVVLNIPAISFLLVLFLLLLLPLFYFRKESHYVTFGGFQSRAVLLPQPPSWTLKPSSIQAIFRLMSINMKIYFQGL